jgi:hypothetical protein
MREPFEARFRRRLAEQCYCLGPEILGGLTAATGGLSASCGQSTR